MHRSAFCCSIRCNLWISEEIYFLVSQRKNIRQTVVAWFLQNVWFLLSPEWVANACLLARNVTQHATRTQKNFTHILALMVRNRYCIELLRNRKQFLSTRLRKDLLQNHAMTQKPLPYASKFVLFSFMSFHAKAIACKLMLLQ